MPLKRSTIAKAVGTAFKALGDIPEAAILRRVTSTYNTATGTNVVSNSDASISKAVFTRYQSFEVDKVVVRGTDVKMIIQQSEVSAEPDIALDLVIRKGVTYNILNVAADPAAATYSLQLRAT